MSPMPESSVDDYRVSLGKIDWSLVIEDISSSDMVDVFQKMTTNLVDIHFPLKRVTISSYDKPWITEELKSIRRRRQRIYRREGRSENYLLVKQDFDDKLKVEAAKNVEKIRKEVVEG